MKNRSAGFTLIEMLVVIAILAGLVAILFPNFMEIRLRARDDQRKSDLRNIQKALEYYKEDMSPIIYPDDTTFMSLTSPWKSGTGTLYMAKLPTDPGGICAAGTKYYYHRISTDTLQYVLYACLENTSDSEGQSFDTEAPWFVNQTGCTCTSGKYYKVTNP